jgi:GrpB-like predicted nucleotidyltransferase (UPF0157 family)
MIDPTSAAPAFRPGGPIVLATHDAGWALAFAHESAAIAEALGAVLVQLHHVGSTAIPGIVAKPVIDMLAVVTSVDALDSHAAALVALGYEAMGEFGIAGRRYFRKGTAAGVRTHQVHAFGSGSGEIARHLDFRDYLCAHPEEARAYEALKIALARDCHEDIAAYTDRKTEFIRERERRAVAWTGIGP